MPLQAGQEVVEAVEPEEALEAIEAPILFSYSRHDLFVNRLSLRVANSPGGAQRRASARRPCWLPRTLLPPLRHTLVGWSKLF